MVVLVVVLLYVRAVMSCERVWREQPRGGNNLRPDSDVHKCCCVDVEGKLCVAEGLTGAD